MIPPQQWGSRTTRELLKTLAAEFNEVVPDDRLLEALWPDQDPERARRSLWVRVSELRKLFSQSGGNGSAIIRRGAGGYSLHPSPDVLMVDADCFTQTALAAIHAGEPAVATNLGKKARELYRGEFLADDPYNDRWLPIRARLSALHRRVSESLAALFEDAGQHEAAIDVLQSILSPTDPQETHYRALMRLHYKCGGQTSALRVFEECRTALASVFGVRPMPETMRLLETIVQQNPLSPLPAPDQTMGAKPSASPVARPVALRYPFLGREYEINLLRDCVTQLNSGQGSVVWIEGESGVGKSRLINEAFRADELGQAVLYPIVMRGHSLANAFPFSAVLDALQEGLGSSPIMDELHQLLQEWEEKLTNLSDSKQGHKGRGTQLGAFDPVTLQVAWLRQRILELVARLVEKHPIVLLVDHVDGVDPSSLDVLVGLSRRNPQLPVLLVVVSEQPMERLDFGRVLSKSAHVVQRISLKPLSPSDLTALLGEGVPTSTARRWLTYVHELTDGDPFTLTELLRWLEHSGSIVRNADGTIDFCRKTIGQADLAGPPQLQLAQGVRDKLDRRITSLSKPARTLLVQAAVLGESLSLDRLKRLSRASAESFGVPFEELLAEGFLDLDVTDMHTSLRFAHARLHNHIYYQTTSAHRQWIHRQAAQLIEDEISTDAQVDAPYLQVRSRLATEAGYHARRAADYEKACYWFLISAKSVATQVGSVQSVALYQQALEVAEKLSPDHRWFSEARRGLGNSLYSAYRFGEAIPLLEAELASGEHDTLEAVQMISQLVLAYMQFNRSDDATRWINRLFSNISTFEDPQLKGSALLSSSFVMYRLGQTHTAIEQVEQAIPLLASHAEEELALAYRRRALYHWDISQYGLAIRYARHAVTVSRRRGDTFELVRALNQLGELYQDLFCVESADQVHHEALQLAVEGEYTLLSTEIERNLGMNALYRGDADKAFAALEKAWQQILDFGASPYWQEIGLRALIEAHLLHGEVARVTELLADYESVAGPRETPFVAVFRAALALGNEDWSSFEASFAETQHFWSETQRRARVHHVLLFMGRAFVASGASELGRNALSQAVTTLEKIADQLPDDLAAELTSSRAFQAARATLSSLELIVGEEALPSRPS